MPPPEREFRLINDRDMTAKATPTHPAAMLWDGVGAELGDMVCECGRGAALGIITLVNCA